MNCQALLVNIFTAPAQRRKDSCLTRHQLRVSVRNFSFLICNGISYLGELMEEDYFFAASGGTNFVGIPFAIGY
jgi:hypothetical protein